MIHAMYLSIAHFIERGFVDNTEKGRIVLSLKFAGRETPFEWEMEGNCLQDIAGCRLLFDNPLPASSPEDEKLFSFLEERLHALVPGDMTASRRLYDRDNRRALGNALSLELLDFESGGRLLLESGSMILTAEAPAWLMSSDEDAAQRMMNQDALRHCLQRSFEQYRAVRMPDEEVFPAHSWDLALCEAEARAYAYNEVHEKYAGIRGSETSEAYALGCDFMLARQAYADEHAEPPVSLLRDSQMILANFLSPDEAAAVQKLAANPIYRLLAELTEFFRHRVEVHVEQDDHLPPGEEPEEREAFRRVIEKQASILPLVLATLLAIQGGNISRQHVAARSEYLTARFDELVHLLHDVPEGWARQEAPRLVEHARNELADFCREKCSDL